MDDSVTKLLMKKVKKYKKWTEGAFVNPVYWMVNGTPYYMAGFTKNNAPVATAYLTIGDEKLDEALEAQRHLAIFADLNHNVLDIGKDFLKINANYFTQPLSIPVDDSNLSVLTGKEAFSELWKNQQKIFSLVTEYKQYYETDVLIRREIFMKDIIKTQEAANLLTLYQYLNLKILLDNNDEIHAFSSFLKTTKQWRKLDRQSKKFVKGISGNLRKMRKSMDNLNLIIDEDFETMITLNYNKMIEENKPIIEGQRKYIRYPK